MPERRAAATENEEPAKRARLAVEDNKPILETAGQHSPTWVHAQAPNMILTVQAPHVPTGTVRPQFELAMHNLHCAAVLMTAPDHFGPASRRKQNAIDKMRKVLDNWAEEARGGKADADRASLYLDRVQVPEGGMTVADLSEDRNEQWDMLRSAARDEGVEAFLVTLEIKRTGMVDLNRCRKHRQSCLREHELYPFSPIQHEVRILSATDSTSGLPLPEAYRHSLAANILAEIFPSIDFHRHSAQDLHPVLRDDGPPPVHQRLLDNGEKCEHTYRVAVVLVWGRVYVFEQALTELCNGNADLAGQIRRGLQGLVSEEVENDEVERKLFDLHRGGEYDHEWTMTVFKSLCDNVTDKENQKALFGHMVQFTLQREDAEVLQLAEDHQRLDRLAQYFGSAALEPLLDKIVAIFLKPAAAQIDRGLVPFLCTVAHFVNATWFAASVTQALTRPTPTAVSTALAGLVDVVRSVHLARTARPKLRCACEHCAPLNAFLEGTGQYYIWPALYPVRKHMEGKIRAANRDDMTFETVSWSNVGKPQRLLIKRKEEKEVPRAVEQVKQALKATKAPSDAGKQAGVSERKVPLLPSARKNR